MQSRFSLSFPFKFKAFFIFSPQLSHEKSRSADLLFHFSVPFYVSAITGVGRMGSNISAAFSPSSAMTVPPCVISV